MKTFITSEPNLESKKTTLESLPSSSKKIIAEIFGENVTDNDLKNQPTEGNEDIFDPFLDNLPDELLKKSLSESVHQQKNLLEALTTVLLLIEQRKNTWQVDGEEPYKEEVLETIKLLSSARFDESLFLGRGNAGHVFLAPGTNNFCIKYLHNPSRQSSNIDEEFTLLGQVNEIARTFEALKIPQAHAVAKNIEGSKNFFTMEKISGLTVAQLVNFPSKRETEFPDKSIHDLIKIFENIGLREKILRDLTSLHNAGIIHGDIHERNIMLDGNGDIFLIDFGNAVVPVNVSVQATYENIENVKELDVKAFFNTLDAVISQLKAQLTN